MDEWKEAGEKEGEPQKPSIYCLDKRMHNINAIKKDEGVLIFCCFFVQRTTTISKVLDRWNIWIYISDELSSNAKHFNAYNFRFEESFVCKSERYISIIFCIIDRKKGFMGHKLSKNDRLHSWLFEYGCCWWVFAL